MNKIPCDDCKHWRSVKQAGAPHCRRFPPTPIMVGMQAGLDGAPHPMIHAYYPPMPSGTEACGEFKQGTFTLSS